MKEQLERQISEILDRIISAVDTAAGQLPEIAEQALTYYAIESFIGLHCRLYLSLVGLLLIITGINRCATRTEE